LPKPDRCKTFTTIATHLDLETSGRTTTTSLLELTAFGLNIRFLVLVWSHAKVLNSLSGVLWSSKEESVASGRGSQGQLIESQGLSPSGKDARTSGSSEAESSHAELGDGQETIVIGDGADHNDGLVV